MANAFTRAAQSLGSGVRENAHHVIVTPCLGWPSSDGQLVDKRDNMEVLPATTKV